MPKATKGFITEFGEFFENRDEANYSETKTRLRIVATEDIRVTKEQFAVLLSFAETHHELLKAHCENYAALKGKQNVFSNTARGDEKENADDTDNSGA